MNILKNIFTLTHMTMFAVCFTVATITHAGDGDTQQLPPEPIVTTAPNKMIEEQIKPAYITKPTNPDLQEIYQLFITPTQATHVRALDLLKALQMPTVNIDVHIQQFDLNDYRFLQNVVDYIISFMIRNIVLADKLDIRKMLTPLIGYRTTLQTLIDDPKSLAIIKKHPQKESSPSFH